MTQSPTRPVDAAKAVVQPPRFYGVTEIAENEHTSDLHLQSLRLRGFTVVDGLYKAGDLKELRRRFDEIHARYRALYPRVDEIGEANSLRAPLALDRCFLDIALNPQLHSVLKRMLGDYFVLNQQNGLINPPLGAEYEQGAFHRDLPYQHFTSSRPLALNALFCLDDFSAENGSTKIIPGSQHMEACPSPEAIAALSIDTEAPAGSYLLLDCMCFHSGGVNRTEAPRRAINNVFTIPIIKQQICLPSLLGEDYPRNETERKLLGYGLEEPRDVEDWIARRFARKYAEG